MFVDQDALIRQNTGVATVWLMSTIGSRSSSRKISRREIQCVSIPETCDVIKEPPQGPLTLRVSSSLLYGVAVVFRQKTDYLSSDTQAIRTRIQRDLLSVKTSNKHLIEPPVLQVQQHFNPGPFFSTKSSSVQGKGQVLFDNDPLFHIDDGLLPPLDQLDFLAGASTQQEETDYDKQRKLMIRAADVANNTISQIISHITSSEDDSTIFSQPHMKVKDELDSALEPQFAFNDDGMLLELGDNSNETGPVGRADFGNMDEGFDFVFDEDIHRVLNDENSDKKRSRSGSVRPELDQVLEEVNEEGNIAQEGDRISEPSGVMSKTIMKRRTDGKTRVVWDSEVSISTDMLRDFRDNYVESMLAKKRTGNSELTAGQRIEKMLHHADAYVPSFFSARTLKDSVAPIEQPRGRDLNKASLDEEDFVSGLLRRRRSSSIETGRNSSGSCRDSRGSIAGVTLQFNDTENDGGADVFDYDFNDVLGGDSTSGSKKRSSTPSFSRIGPVPEDNEMEFLDFGDNGEDLLEVPKGPDNISQGADSGSDIREKHTGNTAIENYDKTTSMFLAFVKYRLEEDRSEQLTFRELLGNEYFQNMPDPKTSDYEEQKRRTAIVGSFYSVLQLATHAQIEVVSMSEEVGDRGEDAYKIYGPDDLTVKMAV